MAHFICKLDAPIDFPTCLICSIFIIIDGVLTKCYSVCLVECCFCFFKMTTYTMTNFSCIRQQSSQRIIFISRVMISLMNIEYYLCVLISLFEVPLFYVWIFFFLFFSLSSIYLCFYYSFLVSAWLSFLKRLANFHGIYIIFLSVLLIT